ncbi:MAG: hypothetical protein JWN03_5547 [Nocardia sp.]|nr:hypothetical protein [Nocardia sp.]
MGRAHRASRQRHAATAPPAESTPNLPTRATSTHLPRITNPLSRIHRHPPHPKIRPQAQDSRPTAAATEPWTRPSRRSTTPSHPAWANPPPPAQANHPPPPRCNPQRPSPRNPPCPAQDNHRPPASISPPRPAQGNLLCHVRARLPCPVQDNDRPPAPGNPLHQARGNLLCHVQARLPCPVQGNRPRPVQDSPPRPVQRKRRHPAQHSPPHPVQRKRRHPAQHSSPHPTQDSPPWLVQDSPARTVRGADGRTARGHPILFRHSVDRRGPATAGNGCRRPLKRRPHTAQQPRTDPDSRATRSARSRLPARPHPSGTKSRRSRRLPLRRNKTRGR